MSFALSVTPAGSEAERLAAQWRRGALDRDRDPWAEDGALEALAASGLLTAIGRAPAPQVADLVRVLATGDPGLAQQLHGHVGNVDVLALAPQATREAIGAEIDRGARFGNLNRDADLRVPTALTPVAGGFQLDGAKAYCTGAVGAQWLAVPAVLPDGALRVALLPAEADGVAIGRRWEAFGQRATRSVSVELTRVQVPADHVVDAWADARSAQARELRAQIPHPALEVGIAEAVLAEPWPRRVREHESYAVAAAHVAAARALLDEAAHAIEALAPRPAGELAAAGAGEPSHAASGLAPDAAASPDAAGPLAPVGAASAAFAPGAPDPQALGEASLALFAARALAYRTSVRTADAATRWLGGNADLAARIDLHWRNARTHSVHDPGRWAFHHVGRHVLTGAYPAPRSPGLKHRAAELVAPPRAPAFTPTGHAVADAARAALAEAARFVAERPHAWPEAGVERAADEPHAILRFGELAVRLRALDALVARGSAHADRYADAVALRIVSDALEIAGASALTVGRNLDRHWREIVKTGNPIKFM